MKVTSKGWEAADFKPDQGAYRCDIDPKPMADKSRYGKGLTLADVGKSMVTSSRWISFSPMVSSG